MDILHRLSQITQGSSRRTVLIGTAAVLILVSIVVWGVLPVYEYRQELRQRQEQTRQQLAQVSRLAAEYRQAKRAAASRPDDDAKSTQSSLFSFVENQADRDDIKRHIAYMRPNTVESPTGAVEKQVQIRLEDIRLAPFLAFLKHIEYAETDISVTRLTIRSPRDNPGQLRVDLLLAAYE